MPEGNLSIERRAHPRVATKVPVKWRLEKDENVLAKVGEWKESEENAYTLNLSTGGTHLAIDQPLAVGAILRFDLYLLERITAATIYAEVKWSDEKGVGLRFLMMPEDEKEALQAFLEKTSAG